VREHWTSTGVEPMDQWMDGINQISMQVGKQARLELTMLDAVLLESSGSEGSSQ